MRSTFLCILCALSVTALQAKSALLEETSLTLPTRKIANEDFLEDFSTLDEEFEVFEEELSLGDEALPQEKSEPTAVGTSDFRVHIPVIDLSEPLENIEMPLAIEIVEDVLPAIAAPVEQAPSAPIAKQEQIEIAPVIVQKQAEQPVQTPVAAKQQEEAFEDEALIYEPTLISESEEIADAHAIVEAPATFSVESSSTEIMPNLDIEVDLTRAFAGSPLIYSLLFGMSVFCVFIWVYSVLSLKRIGRNPRVFLNGISSQLNGNNYDEAMALCANENTLLSKMVLSGIQTRKYGLTAMIESMKAEGKRSSMNFWQRIGLLNDVAILAPMLGLLGTVLGMFYAFYDVNRSIESITTLFDGLGISIGTTVAGLIVAILALILHSTAKYRLVHVLSQVESEAYSVASLIDSHTTLYSSGSK